MTRSAQPITKTNLVIPVGSTTSRGSNMGGLMWVAIATDQVFSGTSLLIQISLDNGNTWVNYNDPSGSPLSTFIAVNSVQEPPARGIIMPGWVRVVSNAVQTGVNSTVTMLSLAV